MDVMTKFGELYGHPRTYKSNTASWIKCCIEIEEGMAVTSQIRFCIDIKEGKAVTWTL